MAKYNLNRCVIKKGKHLSGTFAKFKSLENISCIKNAKTKTNNSKKNCYQCQMFIYQNSLMHTTVKTIPIC